MNKKQFYSSPETEVVQVRLEGVIAASEPVSNSISIDSGIFDYTGTEQNW